MAGREPRLAAWCRRQDHAAAPAAPEGAPAAATPVKRMTLWQLIVVGGLGDVAAGGVLVRADHDGGPQLPGLISEKKLMPPAVLAQLKTAARQRDLQTLWDLLRDRQPFHQRPLKPA